MNPPGLFQSRAEEKENRRVKENGKGNRKKEFMVLFDKYMQPFSLRKGHLHIY